MGDKESEPWVPSSKEDWADVFALGLRKHREESFNEAAAFEEARAKGNQGGGNGNGDGGQSGDAEPPKKRTIGDILLGN